MTIYFTSDLHFFHNNVILYDNRPFANTDEMNAALVDNWNATVKPEDTVYFLGDLSLNHNKGLSLLARLNGKIHYIAGNHCPFWKEKDAKKHTEWTLKNTGVVSISKGPEFLEHEGIRFKLSHFPYAYAEAEVEGKRQGEQKHANSYNKKEHEHILLHGHCHTAWWIKGNMINVGCMHWDYKPVSIETIIALAKEKEII